VGGWIALPSFCSRISEERPVGFGMNNQERKYMLSFPVASLTKQPEPHHVHKTWAGALYFLTLKMNTKITNLYEVFFNKPRRKCPCNLKVPK